MLIKVRYPKITVTLLCRIEKKNGTNDKKLISTKARKIFTINLFIFYPKVKMAASIGLKHFYKPTFSYGVMVFYTALYPILFEIIISGVCHYERFSEWHP